MAPTQDGNRRRVSFSDSKATIDEPRSKSRGKRIPNARCEHDLPGTSVKKAKTDKVMVTSTVKVENYDENVVAFPNEGALKPSRRFDKTIMTEEFRITEHNVKAEDNCELEFLNHVAMFKESTTFVPSTRFHVDVMEEEFQINCETVFRERAIEAIGKPFDEEEYARLQKVIKEKEKDYFDQIPEALRIKLRANRFDKRRCLGLLRGYFFWKRNATPDGSFEPWRDIRCIRTAFAI